MTRHPARRRRNLDRTIQFLQTAEVAAHPPVNPTGVRAGRSVRIQTTSGNFNHEVAREHARHERAQDAVPAERVKHRSGISNSEVSATGGYGENLAAHRRAAPWRVDRQLPEGRGYEARLGLAPVSPEARPVVESVPYGRGPGPAVAVAHERRRWSSSLACAGHVPVPGDASGSGPHDVERKLPCEPAPLASGVDDEARPKRRPTGFDTDSPIVAAACSGGTIRRKHNGTGCSRSLEQNLVERAAPSLKAPPRPASVASVREEPRRAFPLHEVTCVAREAGVTHRCGHTESLEERLDAGVKGLAWSVPREGRALHEHDAQAGTYRRDSGGAPAGAAAQDQDVGIELNWCSPFSKENHRAWPTPSPRCQRRR